MTEIDEQQTTAVTVQHGGPDMAPKPPAISIISPLGSAVGRPHLALPFRSFHRSARPSDASPRTATRPGKAAALLDTPLATELGEAAAGGADEVGGNVGLGEELAVDDGGRKILAQSNVPA